MDEKIFVIWFSLISVILVLIGLIFTVYGLDILPVINQQVLVPWVSSIYGAVLIGWGMTLFFVGRYALTKKDYTLLEYLLSGLFMWLAIEALFSFYLGVYFNVGVDIVVFFLFAVPLGYNLLGRNKNKVVA